jgi:hypothetical protein
MKIMKFRIKETYTDYGYKKSDIEIATDSTDEFPVEKEKAFFVPYKGDFKKYEVTIENKPTQEVFARNSKHAARICRQMYDKEKIKILGVKEI